MPEDEPCINEKKGLLQECLPGVTLYNNHAYYNQRHPPDSFSPHPREIDQLQQQMLISNVRNKMSNGDCNDDCNDYSSMLSSFSGRKDRNLTSVDELSSSIHVLWIEKDNEIDSFSDDDELDDIASYSLSIRRAAALSEAKRRSEDRWILYFKCLFIAVFCFLLWDEFQPPKINNIDVNFNSTDIYERKFRFNKHWKKKVNSMYVGEQDGRDGNNIKKIMVVLKDLDEAIHGDIVLRSNKTKFINAATVWQRQDCVFDEQSSLPSSSEQKVPPLAVVEAISVDDVKLVVPILGGLARDYNLEFRVRSGGYAYMSGYSTISNGVMLSLVKLNTLTIHDQETDENNEEVDGISNATKIFRGNNESRTKGATSSKIVVMGPGVRTEDFMKKVLDDNGYSGVVASTAGVGMGGFVLGGGYGLQSRMYGLAIDNILRLKVVLPSGEIKEVKEGDDLFWALRGTGGGNIGVVTSIAYQVYPCHDIKLAASVKVSLLEMTQFLQQVGDKEYDLAPEFTLSVQGYSPTNGTSSDLYQPVPRASIELNAVNEGGEDGLVTIFLYWMGDSTPDDPVGVQYIKNEIVALFSKNSTIDNIVYYYFSWSAMSREREQNSESKSVWSAQSWNGFLLSGNNTQEIWADIESSLSALFTYCKFVSPKVELWGGAISKIPSNATVFPHRDAVYNIGIDLVVPTESDADAASDEMHLVNAIWPSIARHLDGVYVNYPMASLSNESYPKAYWGDNLDRLMVVTERYDPSRVLKIAQGVPTRTKNDATSPKHF